MNSPEAASAEPASRTKVRRLHIGGQVRREGWEVLDANPGPAVDHVGDARDLSRFPDAAFDEIYASHVLEHLDYAGEIAKALAEWHRVLKPGGRLHISVPDLDILARLFLERDRLSIDDRFHVMRMMFGGHIDPHDYHQAGLNEEFLARYLGSAGFVRIRRVPSLGIFRDTSEEKFKETAISVNMNAEKPLPPRVLFGLAVDALNRGQLTDASVLCDELLAVQPDHRDGLHLRGTLALQAGDPQTAVEVLNRAAALAPEDVFLLSDLGNALLAAGRSEEAEARLREVVRLRPDFPPGHFNLGNLLAAQTEFDEAADCYRKALGLDPGFMPARVNLGNALKSAGRFADAEAAFREALAAAPDHPMLLVDLGNVLKEAGKVTDAEACLRRATGVQPDFAPAHLNLGILLQAGGRREEALRVLQEAVRLAPESAEAHCALGDVLQDLDRLEAAVAEYRRAIDIRPEYADACYNLGNALRRCGNHTEAARAYHRCLELDPKSPDAWNNLGNALVGAFRPRDAIEAIQRAHALAPGSLEIEINLCYALQAAGQVGEAAARLRRALERRPDPATHSAYLMLLSYDPEISPEALFAEHVEWAHRYAGVPVSRPAPPPAADPARRLRIGYVSPDFRTHSVAFFFEPVLARHDRKIFEVFCYSASDTVDEMTRRLQGNAEHWRSVFGLADEALAQLILQDRVDILVDLAGHTSENRLGVFAHAPAPVQVTWIGYNNTTGMAQMDYRFTDEFSDPPGDADRLHTERLVRLPGGFCCYSPPLDAPAVAPLPASRAGHVTFGCFNNPAKLNAQVFDLWAMLLRTVPDARLFLKGNGLGDAACNAPISQHFARQGIVPERVEFSSGDPTLRSHLDSYSRVDIALDPFPYNGVTTTCEALWMGVPVVTLAGRTHGGRTGVSLLTHAGFPGWVASSGQDYVNIAAALVHDLGALGAIRARLRDDVRRSPMTDAVAHTRAVEHAYREMWAERCRSSQ